MELNIDGCLQMMVASNCSNVTSFDLRLRPKTGLNRAEVEESNESSSKLGKPVRMTSNLPQKSRHLKLDWLFCESLFASRSGPRTPFSTSSRFSFLFPSWPRSTEDFQGDVRSSWVFGPGTVHFGKGWPEPSKMDRQGAKIELDRTCPSFR